MTVVEIQGAGLSSQVLSSFLADVPPSCAGCLSLPHSVPGGPPFLCCMSSPPFLSWMVGRESLSPASKSRRDREDTAWPGAVKQDLWFSLCLVV